MQRQLHSLLDPEHGPAGGIWLLVSIGEAMLDEQQLYIFANIVWIPTSQCRHNQRSFEVCAHENVCSMQKQQLHYVNPLLHNSVYHGPVILAEVVVYRAFCIILQALVQLCYTLNRLVRGYHLLQFHVQSAHLCTRYGTYTRRLYSCRNPHIHNYQPVQTLHSVAVLLRRPPPLPLLPPPPSHNP